MRVVVLAMALCLLAGCGGEDDTVTDNDVKASSAVADVAVYCLAEAEGRDTDAQYREMSQGVRDLLRLLREDPDAARDKAANAAEMLDDCGERDDADRLDRARERS